VERIPIHQILEAYVGRLYALQCPPPQQPKIEAAIDAGGQFLRLPKRFFLGTEVGGVPRVELVSPDRQATGPSFSGSLKIDTSDLFGPVPFDWTKPRPTIDTSRDFGPVPIGRTPKPIVLKLGFSYDKADVKQDIGSIDPGAGNLLLIPGPLGGPSGFSLGAYPLNIVENAQYVNDIVRYALRVELGQEWEGRSQTEVYGGYTYLQYAHTQQDEKFLGSIPGFARDFLYSSRMSVDEFNFRLGIFFQALLWQSPLGQLILRAYVEAGPDFARAFARDTLSFTGFPDSTANPTASKTDIGYAAGLRLSVRPTTNTEISGEFRFEERTGLPVIVRDGTNPSKLEMERYSAAIFRIGARLRF